jgi:hypothetical protein
MLGCGLTKRSALTGEVKSKVKVNKANSDVVLQKQAKMVAAKQTK